MRDANGLGWISSGWYAALGKNSSVYSGVGGGNLGAGDDYGLFLNHELGHGFGMPHWGDVTGTKGSPSLRYPYLGDNATTGGGFGWTAALDLQSGQPVSPYSFCNAAIEAQDPMQRVCQSVPAGRVYDPYSDFSAFKILRNIVGGAALQGQVPYRNAALSGSTFVPVDYALPQEDARAYLVTSAAGAVQIMTTDTSSGAELQLRRPPAGDAAFYSPVPSAPAGVRYDAYFDFRYPQQFDTPAITVFGTYNHTDQRMSSINAPLRMRGNLMRLWDPTDAVTLAGMRQGTSYAAFWQSWDLHLKVEYVDGSTRYAALPKQIDATAPPESAAGFARWAVNNRGDND